MAVRVGFVGLGNIGGPMAERLVAAGLETRVHDLRQEAVRELVARGARESASLPELAAASDVIGVCVRDDDQARAVLDAGRGLLAGARAGCVIAIHSTLAPGTVRELGAAASARGVGLVDACVSGGQAGARAGTLTLMVGGEPEHLAACGPLFEAVGKVVVHTGALGNGAAAKLCNNLMTYLAWLAAYEAMLLARAGGLSQDVFERVTRATGNLTDPMQAFLGIHKAPEATRSSVEFQRTVRGFADLAEKDLAATLAWAREHGVALPGAGLAAQLMARVYGVEDAWRR